MDNTPPRRKTTRPKVQVNFKLDKYVFEQLENYVDDIHFRSKAHLMNFILHGWIRREAHLANAEHERQPWERKP